MSSALGPVGREARLTRVEVHIVNGFVDGETGGNPAGLVIDAEGLNALEMQRVARRVGRSETAFVSPSDIASIRLDFFTPTRRIAHCGHATIAVFWLLRRLGLVDDGRLSKETVDGRRAIRVEGERVWIEQSAPRYRRISPGSEIGAEVLASLGLAPGELAAGPDPCVVDTGNAFLVVPLPDAAAVARLRPDRTRVHAVSDELDLIGYYVFSPETGVAGRHAGARMFAPRFGIPEESATGTAAGALACYLHDNLGTGERRLLIEQGRLMEPPAPSLLSVELEVEDGEISSLMVGGTARAVSTLSVEV